MRKVLYNNFGEKGFLSEGIFLEFIQSDCDIYALIELNDGTIENIYIHNVKFDKPSIHKYNSNKLEVTDYFLSNCDLKTRDSHHKIL